MAVEVLPLSDLQYNLKRDPVTYKADFERHYEHFQALEQSFICAPSQYIEKLEELLLFVSQVIQFYPSFVDGFTSSVLDTLLSRSFGMHAQMRAAFMKAFMRLKTKDLIPMNKSIDVAFKLHRCQDKQVRQAMRNFVVQDIKRLNRKQKVTKLNSSVQAYLSKILKDNNPTVAREAVFILIRLFRKNVWNDSRTANLIADACLAKRKKVYSPAVRFFLGQDKAPDEKDSDSDSDTDTHKDTKIKQLRLGHRVGCKTKKREKRLERSIKNVTKTEDRKAAKHSTLTNLAAINLLHDPQTFAERLLRKLERCSDRFEIRLFLLDLITRLVGFHKLILLNLYPFLQRFLRPQQREVTRLLLFAAQASHDEVPPDVMEPLIRTIADNFVTDRASSEAIAVGLNAVREICARCPYAMSEDLLSDLIQYRTYKNKNVVAAARSVIRLFRQINPALLPRKERGRPTQAQLDVLTENNYAGMALSFGRTPAAFSVPGAEALVLAETVAAQNKKPSEGKSKRGDQSRNSLEDGSADETNEDSENEKEPEDEDEDEEDEEIDCDVEEDAGEGSWESCSDSDESTDDDGDDDDGDSVNDDTEVKEETCEEKSEIKKQNRCGKNINSPQGQKTTKNERKKIKSKSNNSDDEGWVDVYHSSDDENLLANQPKLDPVQLKSKAIEIASSRIFTQEEFEAMRRYELAKQKRFAATGSHKRKADESESFLMVDSDEEEEGGGKSGTELVSMSAITRLVKRPRQSKAERMEAIQEGRAGREKYGYKVNRMNPHASTTNREKTKRKAFSMIKHKVKQKAKRSFRDKQIALRDQLRHMVKHMR